MAAAKKLKGTGMALLVRLFKPLEGKAWILAAVLAFSCVLGLTSYHLWHRYGDRIVGQPRYRLDPERLVVTPQPAWIQSDVAASAVTYGQLRDASLLDRELVLQVKQAFGVQPWVKCVKRVNKRFPSTVVIDLEYRRPLAMVEVPAGMFPNYNYEGLLPIDDEGYLLPVEIDKETAASFPKISGVDTSPTGPPGSPWGDVRVAQAVHIVALLESIWEPLQLNRVEVPARPSISDQASSRSFVLITNKRRRFEWGSAPGQEQRGEQTASAKIDGLRQFLTEHGPLDALELSSNSRLTDEVWGRVARRRPAASGATR